jgi:hypothetical protein
MSRMGFHIPPINSVDHLHLHVQGLPYKSIIRKASYPVVPGCDFHHKGFNKGFSWFVEVGQAIQILEQGGRVVVFPCWRQALTIIVFLLAPPELLLSSWLYPYIQSCFDWSNCHFCNKFPFSRRYARACIGAHNALARISSLCAAMERRHCPRYVDVSITRHKNDMHANMSRSTQHPLRCEGLTLCRFSSPPIIWRSKLGCIFISNTRSSCSCQQLHVRVRISI